MCEVTLCSVESAFGQVHIVLSVPQMGPEIGHGNVSESDSAQALSPGDSDDELSSSMHRSPGMGTCSHCALRKLRALATQEKLRDVASRSDVSSPITIKCYPCEGPKSLQASSCVQLISSSALTVTA